MSIKTNAFILILRSFIRKINLNKLIAWVILRGRNYENAFNSAFMKKISYGDSVWDVGAYVGFYTKQFAEKVGSNGIVYAFEPSLINFKHLSANTKQYPNVNTIPYALGKANGKAIFIYEYDNGSASHLCYKNDQEGELVDVFRADTLIEKGIAKIPSAIKIDCEGFEFEVLEGMRNLLENPLLRLIGIEVHFAILEKRGVRDVPKKIEELLEKRGFRTFWPDWSHVIGVRNLE